MKYDIKFMPEAVDKIKAQARYIAVGKMEPQNAESWMADVYDAVATLEFLPARCSLAPEDKLSTARIYMLPVHSHLVLFTINEDAELVEILSLRSGWKIPNKGLGE